MSVETRHGVETYAQTFGQGERPVLAVHCMLGSSNIWGPVFEPLADQITATAFDLPGHGKSADWVSAGADVEYQTLATRIAASFIDRPVDLVGHSFGAVVALRIAAAAPEAIRTLTLIEPVLFAPIAETPVGQAQLARQAEFEALFEAGQAEDAARLFMKDWGVGMPWDDFAPKYRDRFLAQMPIVAEVSRANFTDPSQIIRPEAIEGIDAPVMLIHGTDSPSSVAEVCEAIAARLPDVGVASVPGAGHMIPLSHAVQLSDLIGLNLERA